MADPPLANSELHVAPLLLGCPLPAWDLADQLDSTGGQGSPALYFVWDCAQQLPGPTSDHLVRKGSFCVCF